jgi:hypothetical protein
MGKEIYLEYVSVGRMQKVIAIDPETGLEATIIAPNSAPRSETDRVAVRKLHRMIARHKEQRRTLPTRGPGRI